MLSPYTYTMNSMCWIPLAQFCTVSITAEFPTVWEGIQRLEMSGFKVIAIFGDEFGSNTIANVY